MFKVLRLIIYVKIMLEKIILKWRDNNYAIIIW